MPSEPLTPEPNYSGLIDELTLMLEEARRNAARAINHLITRTYWEVGKRIVEYEQQGRDRATYGANIIPQLSKDLTQKLGRGYGTVNLASMRRFYQEWPSPPIFQTLSEKSPSTSTSPTYAFPLPWSHYVRLLSIKDADARKFYETEALRDGWTVRQLDRQINSQFYERLLLSKNKTQMLRKSTIKKPEDRLTASEEIKDPTILEFLGLKDEYSESDLEDAIISRLQDFLMEMGSAFTFVARQKRLRIGEEYFRVDLLLYHRTLRCLVIIDLKIGKFNHTDAGQMMTYLNYAEEHWKLEGENSPVGLILCAQHDQALARYTLAGKEDQILTAEYKLKLPDEEILKQKLIQAQKEAELILLPLQEDNID